MVGGEQINMRRYFEGRFESTWGADKREIVS